MPDTSDTNTTRAIQVRHECNTIYTNATRARHEQYECDMSAKRVLHKQHQCNRSAARTSWEWHEKKNLILIVTRAKTYFHLPKFTIWQIKDYKKRNNFIVKTVFWKCLVPITKFVWKVHQTLHPLVYSTELCNGKSYIKKLYARLLL